MHDRSGAAVRPRGGFKRALRDLLPADWSNLVAQRRHLYRQRTTRFEVPSLPHFDPPAVEYFLRRMDRSEVYLEYGSGGSTVVAAQRVRTLVSVDNDQHFLRDVRSRLSRSRTTASTRLLHVDTGLTGQWGIPIFKTLTPRRRARWARYPTAPWQWLAQQGLEPDTILVDGRFRVACVMTSVLRMRDPTRCLILFDDYGRRAHYSAAEECCELIAMHGAMAVLRPKAAIDRKRLAARAMQFAVDWR